MSFACDLSIRIAFIMNIYNSLTRKVESFKPINPPKVGIYTCGPTVYDFVHIGNFRTYTTADLLVRTLTYLGYQPKYIMNITDVGHLTGDNIGDADIGDDRMETAAKKEGISAWDIAKFYMDRFFEDYQKLNLIKPEKFTRATDHIPEQINLVQKLEQKGFTYRTSDGIYFDTSKFPDYGKLSTLDPKGLKAGKRVALGEKKNPTDFALWKFSPRLGSGQAPRQMEWDSPWAKGFPGWHIECSAMSMKYLGESFDIHVGGEDLRSTHHPNEIAQSEAATGKQFVKYWIHGAFMLVEGKRMSKSLKNNYKIADLEKQGFGPMALRYLYLTCHYRQQLNFTWESLKSARTAYQSLSSQYFALRGQKERSKLSAEKLQKIDDYNLKFREALENDLNLPQALSVTWAVLKSNIPSADKYDLLTSFNEVFGFQFTEEIITIPSEIQDLAEKRSALRKKGKFAEADKLRVEIEKKGYLIEDQDSNYRLKVIKAS